MNDSKLYMCLADIDLSQGAEPQDIHDKQSFVLPNGYGFIIERGNLNSVRSDRRTAMVTLVTPDAQGRLVRDFALGKKIFRTSEGTGNWMTPDDILAVVVKLERKREHKNCKYGPDQPNGNLKFTPIFENVRIERQKARKARRKRAVAPEA